LRQDEFTQGHINTIKAVLAAAAERERVPEEKKPETSREAAKPLASAATPEQSASWEPPVLIKSKGVYGPVFPIDCISDIARDYAVALSETTQTPVDVSAFGTFGTFATGVQGKIKVLVKPGWLEPLNLYVLLVLASGERKSAVLREVTAPVVQYEQSYNMEHSEEIAESRREKEMLRRELEDLTARATKKSRNPATKSEVFAKQREFDNFKEKKQLRLIADDATPEALTSLLAGNNGVISVISSEGGLFDTLSGRYSTVPNIDTFLKAYSGDLIRVDRKGRESEYITEPYATVLLMSQPDVLESLMKNTTFHGRGLTARFIYSLPESLIGQRIHDTKDIPADIREKYDTLIRDLLAWKPETPLVLGLSEEAAEISRKFFYELEARFNTDLEPIRDYAAKHHGTVARIAGILYLTTAYNFMFKPEGPIPGEIFQNAITIGEYLLEHAKIAYQLMGADPVIADAKYLIKRLEEMDQPETTKRDLWHICKGKFVTVEEMEPALQELIERRYIRVVDVSTGGRPSKKIICNPLWRKSAKSAKSL
jgi:hypothetical protein